MQSGPSSTPFVDPSLNFASRHLWRLFFLCASHGDVSALLGIVRRARLARWQSTRPTP
jgi:hypothetical protein